MKPQTITVYQWLAGLGDAGAGALLLIAPVWTLHVMGIAVLPQPVVFASFVGVFVLGVGLSYPAMPLLWPRERTRWIGQWFATALIRSFVAVFLLAEVAAGRMEGAWLGVALTDGALAAVQWTGLRLGWLPNVSPDVTQDVTPDAR